MKKILAESWRKAAGLIVCLGLILGIQERASAQALEDFKTRYWTTSAIIPAGYYGGGGGYVWVHGGTPYTGGGKAYTKEGIDVSFTDGSDVRGAILKVTNARMKARNVVFKECQIEVGPGGRLSFEDCGFDQVNFVFAGGAPSAGASRQPPEVMYEWLRSHAAFKNCVLKQTVIQMKDDAGPLAGVAMQSCTVYGPGIALPAFPAASNFLEDARRKQISFEACMFHACSYPGTFFALSRDCIFDSCQLIPNVNPPGDGTPLALTAAFRPSGSAHEIRAQHTGFTVSPVPITQEPGSRLEHTLESPYGLRLAGREQQVARPTKSLASALQATTLQSVSTMPAGDASTLIVPPVSSTYPLPTAISPTINTPAGSVFTGNPGAPDIGLRQMQAEVHALLIMSMDRGQAGSSSRLSAVATPSQATAPSQVRFNQQVGSDMSKALAEVTRYIQFRHQGWPLGYNIDITFDDKYSDKDGPSAAVACALILNSLVTGKALDPAFAVTGDMNADGSVQPIGGVAAKIRGATLGKSKVIAIPAKNEERLKDLLAMYGPGPFAGIQIHGVSQFAEAEALASVDKPPAVSSAVDEMQKVLDVLNRDGSRMLPMLRNQFVLAKLQEIQRAAPNNLSAKYLLMYASGKQPLTLGLAGSIEAVENAAAEMVASIKATTSKSYSSLKGDTVGSSLTRLQTLRSKCDARVRPYLDGIIDFGGLVKQALDRPPTSSARASEIDSAIQKTIHTARNEYRLLVENPAIREELER